MRSARRVPQTSKPEPSRDELRLIFPPDDRCLSVRSPNCRARPAARIGTSRVAALLQQLVRGSDICDNLCGGSCSIMPKNSRQLRLPICAELRHRRSSAHTSAAVDPGSRRLSSPNRWSVNRAYSFCLRLSLCEWYARAPASFAVQSICHVVLVAVMALGRCFLVLNGAIHVNLSGNAWPRTGSPSHSHVTHLPRHARGIVDPRLAEGKL